MIWFDIPKPYSNSRHLDYDVEQTKNIEQNINILKMQIQLNKVLHENAEDGNLPKLLDPI